jgi:circadian clock protein KaiC
VKRAISALKKRTGGHEGAIREIWFDKDGIHLSGPVMHLRGILTGVPTEVTLSPGNAGGGPPPRA